MLNMNRLKTTVLIVVFLGSHLFAVAQEILINEWLKAGSIGVENPAFAQKENVKGDKFKSSDLLKMPIIDLTSLTPKDGAPFLDTKTAWTIQKAGSDSSLYYSFQEGGNRIGFLATYIATESFWKGKLAIESTAAFEAYWDGVKTADRYSTSADGAAISKDITVMPGKHKLILKVLLPDTLTSPSRLKAYLKPAGDFLLEGIYVSLNPRETKTLGHLLEGPKLSGISISAAGDMVLITTSEIDPKTEKSSYLRRVIRLSDKRLMASFRQTGVSQLKWMPVGNKLSYLSSGNVWVLDLDRGSETELLKGINEISSYTWSPNEEFVIYSVFEKDEGKKDDFRRILSPEDRQPFWRSRSFLYIGHIASGIHQRLTWGNRSTSLQDISPDGKSIIFSTSQEDYLERPYSRQSLYRMDLSNLKVDTLWTDKLFSVSVSFSPDGAKLLATGSSLAFGDLGVNVSPGKTPNIYDTQAYIYDIATGNVEAITRDFNPSIDRAYWCPISNRIYFTTTDEDRNTLYEFNPQKKSFASIALNEEMINGIDFARSKPLAVYYGSGVKSWPKAYSYDFKAKKSTLIEDVETKNYSQVVFGDVKEWWFTSSRGQKVLTRYYLPPNFSADKKYPMIVYYYGGTTPVGRDFGGRYPKQLYAANGFVVLVLQPSGTVGFGQDFSAAHVNAWGKVTADEIIEGTKQFVAQHPFVNESKIGCIGASYGGFMTMYLLTQTDIFAAAISHAGISSIASYWGEGYWGYSYSAAASANSFPWNNRDLYVNQSPLFSADKISTPLLLLHGSDDTNVPVGESIQMYTALKLLGKPVDLIQIEGADHHILKYGQRVKWTNTILAWFAKYLKDEEGWWKEMYPDGNY